MKILIIIPVYNEELYIKNCINSFINQSHKPDQIVIVNDNSTDNTEKIFKCRGADCSNAIEYN